MKRFILIGLLAASAQVSGAALDPDTSFGTAPDGRRQVYFDLGGGKGEQLRDVAIAPGTGAIYAVGSVDIAPGRSSAALVKRQANGTPDTSFAAGTYSNSWLRHDSVGNNGSARFDAVAFDATNTGALIAAGYRDSASGQRCAYAVKLLDNTIAKGVLDGGFGYQGMFTYCDGDGVSPMSFSDVKVLPDGKILLLKNGRLSGSETGASLIRLLANGNFDTSFNAGGLSGFQGQYNIDVRAGKNESGERIAVTAAGYLVGGSSQYSGNDWDGYVVRVLANGTRDTSYAGGARLEALDDAGTAFDDRLADLVTDASGRAVLLMNSNNAQVRVIRLNSTGQRDTGFGNGGLQAAGLADTFASSGGNFQYTTGAALAINSAQQIWVIGSRVTVWVGVSITGELAMSRLSSTGAYLNFNTVMPYGIDELGATATVGSADRLLIGTRLRTTNLVSDYDFGFLRLLGTP